MVCFLCSSGILSLLLVKTIVRGYYVYGVVGAMSLGDLFVVIVVYRDEELLVIVGHRPRTRERLLRCAISSQSTMVKSWEK